MRIVPPSSVCLTDAPGAGDAAPQLQPVADGDGPGGAGWGGEGEGGGLHRRHLPLHEGRAAG